MIIRIHETDLQGRPVRCTGEFFFGQTNSDIVEGMKLNPFTASMSQADFMRQTLAGIGIPIQLADDPELAASSFCGHSSATSMQKSIPRSSMRSGRDIEKTYRYKFYENLVKKRHSRQTRFDFSEKGGILTAKGNTNHH